jgi:integrase
LDRHMHPVKVDLPGRKMSRNERPFYTFIGRDAVDALKVWLRKWGLGPGAIFLNQYDGPLKKSALRRYWMQRLHRLGLIEKPENADSSIRYGKNLHKMRDLFRSRFQKSQADPMAAEFFMGHVIDPNEYNKAFQDRDYAEEQYLIAEHWLNIMSEDPKKVPIKDVRRMKRRYEKAYQEIREELEYLKELIGERRE